MVTSCSGGSGRSIRREPLTMGKQLTNFITCGCQSSNIVLQIPFIKTDGLLQNKRKYHSERRLNAYIKFLAMIACRELLFVSIEALTCNARLK
jgi:hypothetical protein